MINLGRNTVTLCGSTRFEAQFREANSMLTKFGFSVITISWVLPKNAEGEEADKGLKELLDLVHFNKILRSDAILVVGDGYIGHSTAREIVWADMQDKTIVSYDECKDWEDVMLHLQSGSSTLATIYKAHKTLGLPKLR
jgi:hypothetical protein